MVAQCPSRLFPLSQLQCFVLEQDATASVEDGQGDHPSRPATAGRAATAVDAATEAVTSAIAPTAPAADPISPVCTSAKGDGGGSGRLENESWGAASCSESTSPTSPMENKVMRHRKIVFQKTKVDR